jgi:hypothetical protein
MNEIAYTTQQIIRSKILWWCIDANIVFLDIIHRPVLFNVSETGFCLCVQDKPTCAQSIKLVPIWVGFTLRRRRFQFPKCILNKNRTMDDVEKHNICNKNNYFFRVKHNLNTVAGFPVYFRQLINSIRRKQYIYTLYCQSGQAESSKSLNHWTFCNIILNAFHKALLTFTE